jgi:hypothetical protein
LELLKIELQGIQSSIQNLDGILFQIKGWCVSAALAIGGFAVSTHTPGLTLIGLIAIIGFFFINAQFKVIQRAFIERGAALDAELKSVGIMRVLKGAGNFEIVGTAIPSLGHSGESYLKRIRFSLSEVWRRGAFGKYIQPLSLLVRGSGRGSNNSICVAAGSLRRCATAREAAHPALPPQ